MLFVAVVVVADGAVVVIVVVVVVFVLVGFFVVVAVVIAVFVVIVSFGVTVIVLFIVFILFRHDMFSYFKATSSMSHPTCKDYFFWARIISQLLNPRGMLSGLTNLFSKKHFQTHTISYNGPRF